MQMIRILIASLAVSVLAQSSMKDSQTIMRSQKEMGAVSIDPAAQLASVHPHGSALIDQSVDLDDPCGYLGCQSHKCSWTSGETISKVAAKKSCSNAKAVTILTGGIKIETLSQCVRAVKDNAGNHKPMCDSHFEMNMETNECMCVPTGEECKETAHEKVCRYQMKMPLAAALIEKSDEGNDPCSYLGCQSHKCSWSTGESIGKVASKKTCSNAKAVANPIDGIKIETLTQCVHAVKGKTSKDKPMCNSHFMMNMETNECMCVPAGEECKEAEHEKVCRYQMHI